MNPHYSGTVTIELTPRELDMIHYALGKRAMYLDEEGEKTLSLEYYELYDSIKEFRDFVKEAQKEARQ